MLEYYAQRLATVEVNYTIYRMPNGNAALCVADTDEGTTPFVSTADFGYFRLRDEGYAKKDLEKWVGTVRDLGKSWRDAFIFFKHEESGIGPKLAQQFAALLKGESAV